MEVITSKRQPTREEVVKTYARYKYDPVLWARDQVGFECAAWQEEAWNTFVERKFVAWSAGSGVGKTASLAVLILFFLATRPFCKVACTAPSQHQLHDVLWAEIGKWMDQSDFLRRTFKWTQTKITFRGDPEAEKRWFAVARTSRPQAAGTATAAEGLQGMHEGNILFVCDEASGVPDQVMHAIEGSLTTPGAHSILASNPTRRTGFFYRIISDPKFHDEWAVKTINAAEVAKESHWVDQAAISRAARIYGKTSDYYRVKVRGLPPMAEARALCTPEQMYDCHERDIMADLKHVYLGVDVARFGGDATVIYVRKGMKITERIPVQQGIDLMTTSKIVAEFIEKYEPLKTYVDVIGIGAGVVDRLHELFPSMKRRIIGVHVGQRAVEYKKANTNKKKPIDEEKFRNLRAQLFWNLRFLIDKVKIGFDSEFLDEELTNIEYGWPGNDARLQIESKDDIRAKLGRSCNDADALTLCLYNELIKPPGSKVDPKTFGVGRREKVEEDENLEEDLDHKSSRKNIFGISSQLRYHVGSRFGDHVGRQRFSNFGLM